MYTQVTSRHAPEGRVVQLYIRHYRFSFRWLDFQIVALSVKQAILDEPSILRLLGYNV